MVKNEGHGHSNKYCDWCGKYCGPAGVDTWTHNFCSERCKRAYDNAHGTVDGGYKSGSVGHTIHKAFNKIENTIKIILYIIFGTAAALAIISELVK